MTGKKSAKNTTTSLDVDQEPRCSGGAPSAKNSSTKPKKPARHCIAPAPLRQHTRHLARPRPSCPDHRRQIRRPPPALPPGPNVSEDGTTSTSGGRHSTPGPHATSPAPRSRSARQSKPNSFAPANYRSMKPPSTILIPATGPPAKDASGPTATIATGTVLASDWHAGRGADCAARLRSATTKSPARHRLLWKAPNRTPMARRSLRQCCEKARPAPTPVALAAASAARNIPTLAAPPPKSSFGHPAPDRRRSILSKNRSAKARHRQPAGRLIRRARSRPDAPTNFTTIAILARRKSLDLPAGDIGQAHHATPSTSGRNSSSASKADRSNSIRTWSRT